MVFDAWNNEVSYIYVIIIHNLINFEQEKTTAEEPLEGSEDFDDFILEKLRQREDIAEHNIPTKDALVGLGLHNVFGEILGDLKESKVGDLDENILELIALYKVTNVVQPDVDLQVSFLVLAT